MENVVIRRAEPRDLEDLTGLLQEFFAIEADFTPDPGRQRRGLSLLLEDSATRCVVVAEAGGRVVGMGTVRTLLSTAEGGRVGLVEDVIVEPSHRGRGIGRRILEAIAEWAAARGLSRLQLLADRNNAPALAFYDKIGWRRTQLVCLRKK